MSEPTSQPRKRPITPYLLIAPTLIFLAAFFAYPMFQGLVLAVYDDEAVLPLLDEASLESTRVGELSQGAAVQILGQQGNTIDGELTTDLITEQWFLLSAVDVDGADVEGWSSDSRVRVRDEAADGTATSGTVRPRLGENADPLTPIFAEPNVRADVVAQLEERTTVTITDSTLLEVWFNLSAVDEDGATIDGWAPSRFIRAFENGEEGRVDRGSDGEWTSRFISKMFNDRFFGPAWQTTILLMVIIIPLQFILAMAMALVIHSRPRGTSGFLYVYSLPMGMSDLAVGILFFSIFTSTGLLNSILDFFGLVDGTPIYLSADTRYWIIIAIVLAEVWRATSIVMVIIVSGLQAIPDETLEAAELFGASYWQRVRYIILPLLKPSLQVALILRTILAFQVFAVVIALGGGEIVTVLSNETYRQYFELRDNNVASAYAVFILVLSLTSSFFYLKTLRTNDAVANS